MESYQEKQKQKQKQKTGVIHFVLYIIKKIVSIAIILKAIILSMCCIILFQNIDVLLLMHMLESLLLTFLLWVNGFTLYFTAFRSAKKTDKTEEAVHIYADGVVTDKVGILT